LRPRRRRQQRQVVGDHFAPARKAVKVQFFVRRVHIVVGQAETGYDQRRPQRLLEIGGNRQCAPADREGCRRTEGCC